MKKIIKLIIVSVMLGALVSLGTYFYQQVGSYSGVCVVGVESPCNGDEFKDRGYPVRYVNPDNVLEISSFLKNVAFWSVVAFVILKIADAIRSKIE